MVRSAISHPYTTIVGDRMQDSSLQSLHLLSRPDQPFETNSSVVAEAGEERIPDDDDTSVSECSKSDSDETSDEEDDEHYQNGNWTILEDETPETSTMTSLHPETEADHMTQRSYFESEGGAAARGGNQLKNVGRTNVGIVVLETTQKYTYHEDISELGVKIRRYKDDRSGSLSPVGAEGLGVTENPSFGDESTDKCPLEELLTLQVRNISLKVYNFCSIIDTSRVKVLNILMKRTWSV